MLNTPYTNYEELQRNQIMDAAIVCIDRKGVDKTRIGDIAKELGLARQTIYNYFSNKNALVEAVFLRESFSLAENIKSYIADFDELEDKLTHAFLYAVDQFPKNPILSHAITTGGQYLQEMGISRETMQLFGDIALAEVYEAHPFLKLQSQEVSEVISRNIISFLVLPDQNPRTAEELEGFVRRRLIPGLCLEK